MKRSQDEIRERLVHLADEIHDVISDVVEEDLEGTIRKIAEAEVVREVAFRCCNNPTKVPAEAIYAHCSKCGQKVKLRCFGAYVEIYDVLHAARKYFDKQEKELKGEPT